MKIELSSNIVRGVKMTDELKPVLCGCGGEAEIGKKYLMGNLPDVYVICGNCSIRTGEYYSEAEAVEAWNTAMGTNTRRLLEVLVHDATDNSLPVEQTAKVKHLERRSETSMSWEGICTNCGSYTIHEMNYCFHCGARLEWE